MILYNWTGTGSSFVLISMEDVNFVNVKSAFKECSRMENSYFKVISTKSDETSLSQTYWLKRNKRLAVLPKYVYKVTRNSSHLWVAAKRIIRALIKILTPLLCYLLLARKHHCSTHTIVILVPFDSLEN